MSHAPSRRGRASRDEADRRLASAALGLVFEELRRVLFALAADFADHHDRLRLGIGEEHFKDVDELETLDRIAADAHGSGLAEPFARRLVHRLIGERAGARDDADAAPLEDIAGHDADLAL